MATAVIAPSATRDALRVVCFMTGPLLVDGVERCSETPSEVSYPNAPKVAHVLEA